MNDEFYMKVVNHHNIVQNKIMKDGSVILMTVAVGSQNYDLDTAESDCDTFSFILPNFLSFIRGDPPKSYEFEVKDGKCMVKDMRLALNLLRKSNPNSVECFVGQYRVYNAAYKEVFDTFFQDDLLFFMVHCNYKHMFDAICGTIKGMEGRNMSYGKKASHILRLASLFNRYQNNELLTSQYLKMDAHAQNKALMMKINDVKKEEYENWKDEVYNKLKNESENFDYSSVKHIEETGLSITDKFQLALIDVYFQENGYEKQSS
jgi:predicted nucleotidyltransferase